MNTTDNNTNGQAPAIDYNQPARSMGEVEANVPYEGIMPEAYAFMEASTSLHQHGYELADSKPVLYTDYFVGCGFMAFANPDTSRVLVRVWSQTQEQFLELELDGTQYLDYLKPDDSGWADLVNLVLAVGEPLEAYADDEENAA